MKHNTGSFSTGDAIAMTLLAFLVVGIIFIFCVSINQSVDEGKLRRDFYNSNGYIQVKYQGTDMWIKKSDIDLITYKKIEK